MLETACKHLRLEEEKKDSPTEPFSPRRGKQGFSPRESMAPLTPQYWTFDSQTVTSIPTVLSNPVLGTLLGQT